ncbi:hypothetical protein FNL37_2055 [Methylovorus glucosotrophus]|nr:hypothetical protein FNL37_2055 [Methylovorus glucosotrophus]
MRISGNLFGLQVSANRLPNLHPTPYNENHSYQNQKSVP